MVSKKSAAPTPARASSGDKKTNAMEVDQKPTESVSVPPVLSETEKDALTLADIASNVSLLEKSVIQLEKRFALRVLRGLASLRKRLTKTVLIKAAEAHLSSGASRSVLLSALNKTAMMDIDQASSGNKIDKAAEPEVQLYLTLLAVVLLIDQKELDAAFSLVTQLVALVQGFNRRTADSVVAYVYFYYSLLHEKLGKLAECLPVLLSAQRNASLRHDVDSEAVLINLLLRNYLHYNLYDQADKLAAKVVFPDAAGNNQMARYMFYLGRIKAIQLDYSASFKHLMQAVRKSPQHAAPGFQQTAYKFAIIVQLLMGEIPERSLFRLPALQQALIPYFHITQAVRTGDLHKFQETLTKYGQKFKQDKTFFLIQRLRHNVIKTGVRMINLAYSRISLRDICVKLYLDSEEDAEYIVAKAIRDGVINAELDHEKGFVKSKENVDIYSSSEPQVALNQRIQFCLNLHDESVKAMRYPESLQPKKQFETSEEVHDIDAEIANIIEDMEDDDL